tara:strand:+ start:103 stop:1914 length:1812 start_codon:yes stop_codon:yes gene_type:complete
MDEFGSPLAGGIRAVRRNLSSSFFGAPRQANADPVTTNLLQQQSLQLTSVSGQLENISRQVISLDFNLKGVKENLALNEQLERQREGAKQNRERILAEQGLREGKESALENKIQQSLTQPLQRIGIKTQNTLGNLTQFLLTLAGGWLTITGIDLLAALSEGNVDKINKLKTRFLTGLTVIAGTLTAISLGIKKTLGLVALFAGNVGRVAFGGLLKVGLKGVQVLLAGLVKKAALLGGGLLAGGGIKAFLSGIGQIIVGNFLFNRAGKFFTNIFKKPKLTKTVTSGASRFLTGNPLKMFANKEQKLLTDGSKTGNLFTRSARNIKKIFVGTKNTVGAMANPTTTGGLLGKTKGLFNRGKNLIDDGIKSVGKLGIMGKLGKLTKGLPKLGVGKLLGRVFGPLITFFAELTSEDGGLVSALSAVGGFLAGAKIGAALGGLVGSIVPGAGTAVGAFIGGLIGGIIGEELIKRLSKKIMSALGFKDIKVFGNKDKKNGEVEAEGKFTGGEVLEGEPYKVGERGAELFVPSTDGQIVPIKSNLSNAASQIGDVEDTPEIITVPMGGSGGQTLTNSPPPAEKPSSSLPTINFDTSNPHTLYATSVTGAGI